MWWQCHRVELAVPPEGGAAPGSEVCPPDEPTTYPVRWHLHGVEQAGVRIKTVGDDRSDA